MLTEEAHHMQVGESGITRMIERTLETMKYLKTDSIDTIRNTGVIDLSYYSKIYKFLVFLISRFIWFRNIYKCQTTAFANGLKGRPDELDLTIIVKKYIL